MTSKARQLADLGGDTANLEDISSVLSSGPLSNRNLIINGAMQVAQRGTSFTTTTDAEYAVDRFLTRTYGGNGTYTISTLQTDVPTEGGFHYSTKYAVNSAATDTGTYAYGIEHRVEGYNMAQLRLGRSDAKQFTLSFWVKSSVAGTYTGAVRTHGAEYSYVFEYVLAANTWTKITETMPALTATLSNLDETTGAGLLVSPINFGAQTAKSTATTDTWISGNYVFTSNQVDWMGTAGATCYLTGVQLEVGDTATPFEHRSYGQELALCQRYFQALGGTNTNDVFASGFTATNNFFGQGKLNRTMRSAPSASVNGTDSHVNYTHAGVAASASSAPGFTTNPESFFINIPSSTTTTNNAGAYARITNTSTQLYFDAEL